MPEQPAFEVEARSITDEDQFREVAPEWSEVAVSIACTKPSGAFVTHHGGEFDATWFLSRAAGEAIINALHEILHPWAGKSITDMIWDELVATTQKLLAGKGNSEDRGRARGLAYAIASLRNPYDIEASYEAVRDEAVDRAEH